MLDKNIKHSIRLSTEPLTITGVNTYLPIFGRWAVISISVYTKRDYQEHATMISYGIRPVSNKTVKVSREDGYFRLTREDEFNDREYLANRDGLLSLGFGSEGSRRIVNQEIVIPVLHGKILEFSYLAHGGEAAGRAIAQSVLTKLSSIIEEIRQTILRNLAPDIRSQYVGCMAQRYNADTAKALQRFVVSTNWKMLLMRSDCDERCSNVVDFTLQNNPILTYGIDHSGPIETVKYSSFGQHFHNEERERIVRERYMADMAARQAAHDAAEAAYAACRVQRMIEREKANQVAADMLLEVLGTKMAKEFYKSGRITIQKHGYEFVIAPGAWVQCTDPKGGTGELCIHTVGLSCNPIDEVVIAALNIEHHFQEYMHKAIVHRSNGFMKPNIGQSRVA